MDRLKNIKNSISNINSNINKNSLLSKRNNNLSLKNKLKFPSNIIMLFNNNIDNKLEPFYSNKENIISSIDDINNNIDNITNKNDIIYIRNKINIILKKINNIEKNNISIINYLKNIKNQLKVIKPIISFLLINPLPLQFSTAGIVTVLNKKLKEILQLEEGLNISINIYNNKITEINEFLENEKRRIKNINKILKDIIENVKDKDKNKLKNIITELNLNIKKEKIKYPLNIEENGIKYIIYEYNKNFIPQYYIKVYNSLGILILQSEKSFTTEPKLLIEKMKIKLKKLNII